MAKNSNHKLQILSFFLGLTCLFGTLSCNPFAPRLDPDGLANTQALGDPSNLEGFFRLFKNAYELRDTSLYGQLFASDFIFVYYDFDQARELKWDRSTELSTSYNLFKSVEAINLDWNYFPPPDTTNTEAFVVRNFSLSIREGPEAEFVGTGRVKMRLRRSEAGKPWKAYYWFDDSDF